MRCMDKSVTYIAYNQLNTFNIIPEFLQRKIKKIALKAIKFWVFET